MAAATLLGDFLAAGFRAETERDAANGCSEAAWLLRKLNDPELNLDPESVYDFITGHAHNECGWVLDSV